MTIPSAKASARAAAIASAISLFGMAPSNILSSSLSPSFCSDDAPPDSESSSSLSAFFTSLAAELSTSLAAELSTPLAALSDGTMVCASAAFFANGPPNTLGGGAVGKAGAGWLGLGSTVIDPVTVVVPSTLLAPTLRRSRTLFPSTSSNTPSLSCGTVATNFSASASLPSVVPSAAPPTVPVAVRSLETLSINCIIFLYLSASPPSSPSPSSSSSSSSSASPPSDPPTTADELPD
mmetsp:Transcript_16490/g.39253  ORF Transcript_16490/g.39253 Transcript_16490/m.39253 type:complete len:236 (-) Transcript_16490:61-768(-)